MSEKKIPTFLCDLDECVLSFLNLLIQLVNIELGSTLDPSQLTKWDFDGLVLVDDRGKVVFGKEIRRIMNKYTSFLTAASEPCYNAVESIELASELGYKVIFLTARQEETRTNTIGCLLKNRFKHDVLIMHPDKKYVVNELAKTHDIKFYVEDNPKYIADVASLNVVDRIFCVNQPHNRDFDLGPNVTRVTGINEVMRFVKAVK